MAVVLKDLLDGRRAGLFVDVHVEDEEAEGR
jgi:hypothetical protein